MNVPEVLAIFTAHVKETKGSKEALNFYVKYIQPIKDYFGGDDEIKEINLPLVRKSSCEDCRWEDECRFKNTNIGQNCNWPNGLEWDEILGCI